MPVLHSADKIMHVQIPHTTQHNTTTHPNQRLLVLRARDSHAAADVLCDLLVALGRDKVVGQNERVREVVEAVVERQDGDALRFIGGVGRWGCNG